MSAWDHHITFTTHSRNNEAGHQEFWVTEVVKSHFSKDVRWSSESLRRSCVRCGWCRATGFVNSLIPYEQFNIQSLHQGKKLIPEQSPGDPNSLFQMVIDPHHPPPWQNQSHGTIRTVRTTYAAALKTTTPSKNSVQKTHILQLNI